MHKRILSFLLYNQFLLEGGQRRGLGMPKYVPSRVVSLYSLSLPSCESCACYPRFVLQCICTNPSLLHVFPSSAFYRGFSCKTRRRELKKTGGVGSGHRRARGSGGACRARLGGGSQCQLASPPAQEEVRRRLWAPPSQGFGRCLQRATEGRLAMSTRFAASSRRRACRGKS